MTHQKSQNLISILAFLCVLIVLPLASFLINKAFNPEPEKLTVPSIDITLAGTDLETITSNSKETVYSGNILQTSDGKVIPDVSIRGRGNSSWAQPKKPFNITLPSNYSLLGLPPAEKWVLIANQLDNTMLRNDIAFHLSEMLEMPYARQGKFFELYINSEYQGLYYLTHKISTNKNDVFLKNQTGIIAEVDMLWTSEKDCHYSSEKACIVVKDTKTKDYEDAALSDIVRSFSDFEQATKENNYEKVKEIVDIDSLVAYYLLSEFVLDPDAYTTSFYIYKDGSRDKLHFGPGWDFDYALGNKDWDFSDSAKDFLSPTSFMPRKAELSSNTSISKTFYRLAEMPEFIDDVKNKFKQLLSGKRDNLLQYIDNTKDFIYDAVKRNDEEWGKYEFDAEYDCLINWVSARFDFFESLYGN